MTHVHRTATGRRVGHRGVWAALCAAAVLLSGCTSGSDPASSPTPSTGSAATRTAHPGQVSVYPPPGSRTASPRTQISIRGVAPDRIGDVQVVGSKSGPHPGTLRPDSDGAGASFLLNDPLDPGEKVTVHTGLSVVGASGGSYSFTVSRPVSEKAGPGDETSDPNQVQHFASAPKLKPPTFTVQTGSLTAAAGDIFLAPKDGPGQEGPMIVDPKGQLVWFKALPDGLRAYDFRVQHYQGRPVLTWWQGYNTDNGHGQGHGVIYDDSYQPVATVLAGNGYSSDLHDFTITAADTALVTVYQAVRWDTSSVGGGKNDVVLDSIVQEIDIPTGNVLFEWHALGNVPLDESYADLPDGDKQFDFFHVNSSDLEPAGPTGGQLLVSGRATHTIYDVDVATGEIRWRLGGKNSSFTGDGTEFSSQHDSKWEGPNRISLFDNAAGVGDATAKHSSGMIVDLDPSAHTATVEQRFTTDRVPRAKSQGNTQLLPGGGAFVGWGAEPYLSQFSADGKLVWQAALPKKDQTYRAYRFPWSGHPLSDPSAVASVSGGRTTVRASWNGATEVATWRVLGGASASELAPVTTGTALGFESILPLSGSPRYVAVQALNAAGAVLGTSEPVAVTGR